MSVRNVINFYRAHDAYGCFSNFSRHSVELNGKHWPTSEHYFQAMKFEGTPHEDAVRECSGPGPAARMGRRRDLPLRSDWEEIKDSVMFDVCLAKFTQNEFCHLSLLGTLGVAELVEHTVNDSYWGDGGDGSGRNQLGKTLVKVREALTRPEKILFYKELERFGYFSNFSGHMTMIDGREWRTTEQYYQAQKFKGTSQEIFEEIAAAETATQTKVIAWRETSQALKRSDWGSAKDEVMLNALRAKFFQHHDCRLLLLGTGDSILTEHTPRDYYWADGGDGSGKNMLGKLLMQVRAELREKEFGEFPPVPERIEFFHEYDPVGFCSNYSHHPVVIDDQMWSTTEHYYQAQKFVGRSDTLVEEIRSAASPDDSKLIARREDAVDVWRDDWDEIKDDVMLKAVRAKFSQNLDCRIMLLGSGESLLVEHSPYDSYWGDGPDGEGKNMLGSILMRVRSEMKEWLSS